METTTDTREQCRSALMAYREELQEQLFAAKLSLQLTGTSDLARRTAADEITDLAKSVGQVISAQRTLFFREA